MFTFNLNVLKKQSQSNKIGGIMPRGLSTDFMKDLLPGGSLSSILEFVKNDHTLDFEIRKDYADIYYRGGRILGIHPQGKVYSFAFDKEYLKKLPATSTITEAMIKKFQKLNDWENYFAATKQVMDMYFISKIKSEREFQQLVVRENNYSATSNGTDYFIIDIEYDNKNGAKFDLVALEWESKSGARKLSGKYTPRIVVIEMKYGEGALAGTSGILKHIKDFNGFISSTSAVKAFKEEMINVFEQKRQLGLVLFSKTGNNNPVSKVTTDIEFALLIANHDPNSTKLKTILTNPICSDVQFFTANFMGYGLHKNCLYNYNDFMSKFIDQI